jgi:hypothetical protein
MRWMVDNLPLKLASLVLATLLWFVIAGEKTSELGLEVPVELRNFPHGLELLAEPPRSVEVRLRASPGLLQGLSDQKVHATIDLTGVGEGAKILHLTDDSIEVPFGIDVVRISPARITLQFEKTREVDVPVRPNLEGEPAEGYQVAELVSKPATIRVAGPASRVADVEFAYTEALSIHGATRPVTAELAAGLDDPLLRLVGGRRVQVTAQIREVRSEREFDQLEIQVAGEPVRARPARVSVRLRGPASAMAELTAEHITVRALTSDRDEDGEAPVVVELADGYRELEVVACEPARVRLIPAR